MALSKYFTSNWRSTNFIMCQILVTYVFVWVISYLPLQMKKQAQRHSQKQLGSVQTMSRSRLNKLKGPHRVYCILLSLGPSLTRSFHSHSTPAMGPQ